MSQPMPSSYPSVQQKLRGSPLSPAAFLIRLMGGVILLNAFVITLVGLSIRHDHHQHQERAEVTTQNLTQTLESEIAGAVEKTGVTLFAVKDEYEKQSAAGNISRQTINTYIARVHSRLPYIDGLRIADQRGRVVYGNDVAPDSQASLADRNHFIRHRDNPDAGLVISKPVRSRVNNKWVIVFTQRLNHPDGSFAGIVLAPVTLDYLTRTFSTLNVGPRGVVALRDGELGIVVRYPGLQGVGGAVGNMAVAREFREMVAAGNTAGTFTVRAGSDNIERAYSYRKIGAYPLYISVGLAPDDFLADWINEATKQAALAALFTLITLSAAWLIYRSWKRKANAVEALANQETKFRTVADFTFDWEYWIGPQAEVLYMTPSCERVTGYAREQFVADPGLLLRIIHPDDRHVMDRHLHDIAHQTDDQEAAQVTFRIVRNDGETSWIRHHCRAITGQNGEFMGHRVTNRDITKRKLAEDALLTTQHNLTEAQALSHLGSWELDLVHNRLTWSVEMYRIFGLSPEEFGAAYETFLDTLHPEDRDRVDRAYLSSLNVGGRYDIEYRFIRRSDGQLRWGHARGKHVRDADGKVLRSFGSVQDITERKRMENIVERESTRLRTILKTASDGIHILDGDGTLVEANEAFLNMLGYDSSVIGRLGISDWSETSWAESKARIDDLIARHGPAVFEARHRRSDGAMLDVEVSASGIEIEGTSYIYAASRDITARKRHETELSSARVVAEKANNAKSRFLAAASHDLRQPIAALSLYVGILKHEVPHDCAEVVTNIQSCTDSLSELLNDLLDVSKLDAGVVTPSLSDFSVDVLLNNLASIHFGEASTKGLRIGVRDSGMIAHTDRHLLQRIVGNLIANAIRYTNRGGVLIVCRRQRGKQWIEVWDTGIGIPEDKTDFIFEEFRQLGDDARNRGSGLGLAIVAKAAALLGLEVRLRSRLGRGSVFAVELPPGRAISPDELPVPPPTTARTLRIGLVEDHVMLLEALVHALGRTGNEVIAATSGWSLLERLGSRVPDIVISDYRLAAGETGFDVIEAVRGVFDDDHLPAIIVTGDTDPALVRSMADRGIAVHYKPLRIDALLASIKATCHGVARTQHARTEWH